MKNNIPVPQGLLKLGACLSHDIYDKSGKLLLRKGAAVESELIIERIESVGYFDPEAIDAIGGRRDDTEHIVPTGYVPDRSGTHYSVFAELGAACEQLLALYSDPGMDLEHGIADIARSIGKCCAIDSDASIATVLMSLPYPHTVRVPINVATLTTLLLTRQKHDPAHLEQAIFAALTLNIGAADFDDGGYTAQDGLTEAQRAERRQHPGASVEALLARGIRNARWLAIVSQHHEALDGSGYPSGLAGDKILPEAQVIALVDRYCAMITERPDRKPVIVTQALKDIHAHHGKEFAPALVGGLIGAVGIYPPGTIAQLANGEIAVVVHRLLDPKHPTVYAICGPSRTAYDSPKKRLTSDHASHAISLCLLRKDIAIAVNPEQLWVPTITRLSH